MDTSAGPVSVTWGLNRWVLLETPAGSFQQQVSKPAQLALLLTEAGLAREEAGRVAAALWAERPADAALGAARRNEAMWRATGLPWWAVLGILLAVAALFVLFRLRVLL